MFWYGVAVPDYRLTQEFLAIEAVGSRGSRTADPRDPVALEVDIVDDALNVVIEVLRRDDPTRLWRVVVGRWAVHLNPDVLLAGKTYTARFRYEMATGVENVVRQSFVWQPTPAGAHDPGYCQLSGALRDLQGNPLGFSSLVVEEYEDIITLTRRTRQMTVQTDAFGLWYVDVPHDAMVRVVFGDVIKIVRVPPLPAAALRDLPALQPAQLVRTDVFGYPFPGEDPLTGVGPVAPATPAPAVTILTDIAVSAVAAGQPVARRTTGMVPAQLADTVAGVALTSAAEGYPVQFMRDGELGVPDWTAATGAVNLLPGGVYFLAANGTLTRTPAMGTGVPRWRIGAAINTLTLRVQLVQEA